MHRIETQYMEILPGSVIDLPILLLLMTLYFTLHFYSRSILLLVVTLYFTFLHVFFMKQEGWSPYWNFIKVYTKFYRVLQQTDQDT